MLEKCFINLLEKLTRKSCQRQTEGMMHTDMAYRPQNYTDPVTGQVFKLDDRSGTFADYYKKTYGRDLAVEDVRFRGSFGSGLGGILDESKQHSSTRWHRKQSGRRTNTF
jgi:hypothetical protein